MVDFEASRGRREPARRPVRAGKYVGLFEERAVIRSSARRDADDRHIGDIWQSGAQQWRNEFQALTDWLRFHRSTKQ
jgi:hypothetical protein